jgi:hypothetical protein
MAPRIQTDYPYISECDIDAIKSLYDGNKKLRQEFCSESYSS